MEGDDFGLSGLRWCGGGGESVIFLLLELEMLRMLISDSDSLLESRTKSTNSSKLAGCSATFPDFVFSWKLLDFSEKLSPVPISFSWLNMSNSSWFEDFSLISPTSPFSFSLLFF